MHDGMTQWLLEVQTPAVAQIRRSSTSTWSWWKQWTAQVVGLALLLLILIFVLLYTSQGWTFEEPCNAPTADSETLFGYMSFWTCAQVLPPPVKIFLLFAWLLLLISLLATTADNFFVPQLEEMSHRLGLPEDVAGATLLALGNGMPDVMTATSSIDKADDFALTMGEFLGAASFILSIVLGCVLLSKEGHTRVDACAFFRDSIAYTGVLAFMVVVTWDESISLVESSAFFVIYIAYVAIVVLPSRMCPDWAQPKLHQEASTTSLSSSFSEPLLKSGTRELEDEGCRDKLGHRSKANFVMARPFTLVRRASTLVQRHLWFIMYFICVAIMALPRESVRVLSSFRKQVAGAFACHKLKDKSTGDSFERGKSTTSHKLISASDPKSRSEKDQLEAVPGLHVNQRQKAEEEEEEEDLLEGFGDAEGFLSWVQLVMELPFTVMRHASIPSANWNWKRRRLAAICPVFSPLVMLLSFGGWDAFFIYWGPLPVWICCVIIGLLVSLAILLGSCEDKVPCWHTLLLLGAFVCTVGWFNIFANECVAVLETFGLKLGVSSSVLGITVLAWGNSVGDLVADVALVKKGKSKMAVSGCFGSPLFSDLLGLGVALTSYTLSKGPLHASLNTQTKMAAGFTLLVIVITMITFTVKRFRVPRCMGWVLLAAYAAFMLVSVLVETGDIIPNSPQL